MTAWKFHCDQTTCRECLRRELVGETDQMGDHDIQRGDTIFLHDFEAELIYGPFTAETEGLQTLESDAWGDHQKDFPNQVRISIPDSVFRIDTADIEDLDRISDGHIFYDLPDDTAERLLEQLQTRGDEIVVNSDGTTRAVSIDLFNITEAIETRDLWQITPGDAADLWPIWREESIASLGHTLDTSEVDGSRAERLEAIAEYEAPSHARPEYQAFLFQEVVSKDDIVLARHRIGGEIRIYGVGRVIAPYNPDHPTKLGQESDAHDHQIGVAWLSLGADGVAVDINDDVIPGRDLAQLETDAFTTIVRELIATGEIDKTRLEERLGVNQQSVSVDDGTAVEIPSSPEAVDLGELVFPDAETLVGRILGALRTGKHVILTGPPGTGKTELAETIATVCCPDGHRTATATADWSTFDTIGGYRPVRGGELDFTPGIFLETFEGGESSGSSGWLVVDEINRCDIDKAFGSLFTALTGKVVTLPFASSDEGRIVIDGDLDSDRRRASRSRYVIPEDWRLLATMNTYDKMSLYDLSYAFMRRFAFVTVPAPDAADIDIGLVQEYVDAWSDTEDTGEYYRDVAELWTVINGSGSRKIGPAIVDDILQFVQTTDGDFTGAVTMYVLPQFEGIPTRQQVRIVRELVDLDRPALDSAELREFASEYFDLTEEDFDRFGE